MCDLKYQVIFLLALTLAVYSQVQLPYGYGYPHQSLTPYQPPIPYQPALPYQPNYGAPIYQPLPYYPSYNNPNPYGSPYPYQPYPFYPSYPGQQNFQNYPDPYAHLPTEIIDVNEDGSIDPNFKLEEYLPKFELTSTHQSAAVGPGNTPFQPIITSNTVTTKPLQTVVTRVFDSDSSQPKVDVQHTDLKSGSGVLVEADNKSEETDNQVKSSEKSEEDEEEKEEKEEKTEEKEEKTEEKEEKEEKKGGGAWGWG